MSVADLPLAHGYTMADLHALARLAVHTARAAADQPWRDRYETAWSAIAETLYAAPVPPSRRELVAAGQTAILRDLRETRQAYGYYREHTDGPAHGAGSSPGFRAYWWEICGALPTPSPEDRIVDRMALGQILPTLSPGQRAAIVALAVHDTYQAAAAALRMTGTAYRTQVSLGRRRYLARWHEGETPSRPWGCDRRAGTTAGTRRAGGTAMDARRRRAGNQPGRAAP